MSALQTTLPANRQPLVCFAVKACSNTHILKLFKDQGLGADVVSVGEMQRALKAGIPANHIVFSGVGKKDTEITEAVKAGIRQINVESLEELERISALSKTAMCPVPLVLRVNPNVDARTHAKITTGLNENKFGVNLDQAARVFAKAKEMGNVNLCGLSVHIGSQITDFSTFKEAFEKIAQLVNDLKSDGFVISRLDLGGGIGITYNSETIPHMAEYAALIRDIILPLETEIILEPGRVLVGNCGVLLSDVIFEKAGSEKNFLIVDAAMNDLMRPALYDSYHAIEPVTLKPNTPQQLYDVVGPVCESTDVFAKNRTLQKSSVGDLVVFRDAGAYGAVMGSTFNTRELAPEVLVDGDSYKVIRKRWSVDEQLSLED